MQDFSSLQYSTQNEKHLSVRRVCEFIRSICCSVSLIKQTTEEQLALCLRSFPLSFHLALPYTTLNHYLLLVPVSLSPIPFPKVNSFLFLLLPSAFP
uniref:Ovule protein n=1 Tax=Caenorhabditis tropicalis TaxID=1561998 RepID=A0A1I7T4X1_9PELO